MQYVRHNNARKTLLEIDSNPQNYLIIHYSCESFYGSGALHTPRITSIAVRNYATAQTDSFSIYGTAEKRHVEMSKIEERYDFLEKMMLKDFFDYAKSHSNYIWIHWSMRDANYGFKALEHRYAVLSGRPFEIPDSNKIDLSRLLIDCYGAAYADHPRMQNLLAINGIEAKDYLGGAQEAQAFEDKEYSKLNLSTLRKVDLFASILNRAINGTLKTNSKWRDVYGLSLQGLFNFCKDIWWVQAIWSVFMIVLGALLDNLVDGFF